MHIYIYKSAKKYIHSFCREPEFDLDQYIERARAIAYRRPAGDRRGEKDHRGGAADGHAAALVIEAAVQVCLDEDEDCRSRAHLRLYRARPFSTGP